MKEYTTFFAPMIYLKYVAPAIEFYKNALNAIALRQWNNDDGSIAIGFICRRPSCSDGKSGGSRWHRD
ncbi:MAG TPA: hypothetical protein VGQ04_18960, partial [Chitinophagaceae bacterium]|nr:hypothetical protein [Chitinophagaceae bacterium]